MCRPQLTPDGLPAGVLALVERHPDPPAGTQRASRPRYDQNRVTIRSCLRCRTASSPVKISGTSLTIAATPIPTQGLQIGTLIS